MTARSSVGRCSLKTLRCVAPLSGPLHSGKTQIFIGKHSDRSGRYLQDPCSRGLQDHDSKDRLGLSTQDLPDRRKPVHPDHYTLARRCQNMRDHLRYHFAGLLHLHSRGHLRLHKQARRLQRMRVHQLRHSKVRQHPGTRCSYKHCTQQPEMMRVNLRRQPQMQTQSTSDASSFSKTFARNLDRTFTKHGWQCHASACRQDVPSN